MTRTGLALAAVACAGEPALRRPQLEARDVLVGLGSAGVLYVVFQIGDRLIRRLLPSSSAEIDTLYDLSTLAPRPELAARLLLVIAPAEELFWRGLVQARLVRRYGPPRGLVLGTAAYTGAHLAAGNPVLVAAAAVAGGYWGLLALLGAPLSALIVSHAAWDAAVFLLAPVGAGNADP